MFNKLGKVAIIFGSSGQDGIYLQTLLERKQLEVIAVSRTSSTWRGSVADFSFVENLIKSKIPDYIFHLAATSTTKHDVTLENNDSISTGTINILESVKRHSIHSKVFISGSALQFRNEGTPIDENTPFDYLSSYAISRNYSVQMTRYYRINFGVKSYVGYFFNHDSPLRSESHINQKIVSHVVKILNGSQDKLKIGNLNVKKEFSFASDIIEAVWLFVNQDAVFETVIGSGIAYSIKDWIEYCFGKFSLKWQNYIITEEGFKSEYDILVSDPKTIKLIGWNGGYNMYELADLMLESELSKNK